MKRNKPSAKLKALEAMLPRLVAELEGGAEDRMYAFALIEDRESRTVSVSSTASASIGRDRGVVLRILAGGINFEYACDHTDESRLTVRARELRARALAHVEKNGKLPLHLPLPWQEEGIDRLCDELRLQIPRHPGTRTPVRFGVPFDPDFMFNLSQDALMVRACAIYERTMALSEGALVNAGAVLRQTRINKHFCDRTRLMSQSLMYSLVQAHGVTKKGNMTRLVNGGMCGFDALALPDAEALADLGRRAASLDRAQHLAAGRYTVITSPEVTGVIAHEAFGHTQEGDTCRFGRSCAPGLRASGKKIGNDHASIVNNPALFAMGKQPYGQNGSHYFDDEGQLARSQVILDRGMLSSPMNDLMSSLKGDMNGPAPRQSNGKRESWRRPLLARQTNTYFTPGDKTLDELISMVPRGFLARHPYGGMEDPKGMGLTAGTEYLEEIVDGKLTGNFFLGPRGGHVELSDPVPVLLDGIVAKSRVDDDYTGPLKGSPEPYNKWGGCGKYHKELVSAGSGGPWILWKGITCG